MSQTTFGTLGVPSSLVAVLAADGKTEAFPIQADTLPDTLAGRDVLGRGKTGSGKTLAFAIPMAARLGAGKRRSGPGRPRGLILAPTRELATQIGRVLAPLANAQRLKTATVFGGVSQRPQVAALNAGADILVACPGRLEDLMGQGFVRLDAVEITVLDEADHMADLGFLPAVTRILDATGQDGQRMLFSATLDNGVDTIVRRYLHDPLTHSVDDVTSPVENLTHHVFQIDSVEAKNALIRTLASGTGRRILFTRTKHQARKLATKLTNGGIPSVDLHGNLSQAARDRNLAAFGAGSARVLVATDVAARGVHVDDVELVVHVDPPAEHKAYLHRSGRTARAGSSGDVVTVVLPSQRKDTAVLLRKAAIQVTPQTVSADSAAVVDVVGEIADHVPPVKQVEDRRHNKSDGSRPRRGGANRAGDRSQRVRSRRGSTATDQPRHDRVDGRSARGAQARADTGDRDRSRDGSYRSDRGGSRRVSGAKTYRSYVQGDGGGAGDGAGRNRAGSRGSARHDGAGKPASGTSSNASAGSRTSSSGRRSGGSRRSRSTGSAAQLRVGSRVDTRGGGRGRAPRRARG